jgi:hypothetical protein
MSDHDEPAFDDPTFDDVRELLADARVTDPVPDEVAARLDATLVSLQAERVAPRTAAVVPLRHRVGRIMVAAAAVVVIGAGGVGIAQLDLGRDGSDEGATSRPATAADSGGTEADAPESGDGGLAVSPEAPGTLIRNGVARLSHATFAQDAARVMVAIDELAQRGAAEDDTATKDRSQTPLSGYTGAPPVTASPPGWSAGLQNAQGCAGPDAADAITVPATLDKAMVALVFRPPTDDAQQVEAWSCDGRTLLASASVPRS